MKKTVFVIAFCLLAIMGFAQHETIFSKARVVGGFGAPIFEWGLSNDIGTSIGGGGGIVIENFFIGGYGLASVDFDKLFDNEDIDNLEIAHGGFWLGGTFKPHKLFHLYTNARIGWGGLNIDLNNSRQDIDKIFVLTPEIGLELNVAKWFRVAGAVGYRWVNGANPERGYEKDAFNGAVASLSLRFGWFGWRRY